jgi:hypothetical protein
LEHSILIIVLAAATDAGMELILGSLAVFAAGTNLVIAGVVAFTYRSL